MKNKADRSQLGISDAVGYILVLGIIFASITAVYFVGFDYLETARDIEEDDNIDRSLSIFLSNEEEVTSGGAPSRATEIKLGENTVELQKRTSEIRVYLPAENISHTSASGLILFGSPLGTFVYELGGFVKRLDPERDVRLHEEPDMLKFDSTENILHVHMLGMATSNESVSGGIRDIIITQVGNEETVYDFSSSQSIEIYITSPHDRIWMEYFEDKDVISDCVPSGTDQIRCDTVSIDGVAIQQTDIHVELV